MLADVASPKLPDPTTIASILTRLMAAETIPLLAPIFNELTPANISINHHEGMERILTAIAYTARALQPTAQANTEWLEQYKELTKNLEDVNRERTEAIRQKEEAVRQKEEAVWQKQEQSNETMRAKDELAMYKEKSALERRAFEAEKELLENTIRTSRQTSPRRVNRRSAVFHSHHSGPIAAPFTQRSSPAAMPSRRQTRSSGKLEEEEEPQSKRQKK